MSRIATFVCAAALACAMGTVVARSAMADDDPVPLPCSDDCKPVPVEPPGCPDCAPGPAPDPGTAPGGPIEPDPAPEPPPDPQ